MGAIQQSPGYTPGGYGGPDPAFNALYSHMPNRIAQYQQDWRGFETWNTGMGLVHYPPQHRGIIEPPPTQQIYLQRNPAMWVTATPIPIGQYVLSQQAAYTGG